MNHKPVSFDVHGTPGSAGVGLRGSF
jgi:hypothetical protein